MDLSAPCGSGIRSVCQNNKTFEDIAPPLELNFVRFILITDCEHRASLLVRHLSQRLFGKYKQIRNLPVETTVFRLGPVLVSSYEVESDTVETSLSRLLLLCLKVQDSASITVLRVGICAGIGVSPGDVCITTQTLDPSMRKSESDITVPFVCINHLNASRIILAVDRSTRPENLGEFELQTGFTISAVDIDEQAMTTIGLGGNYLRMDKDLLKRANQAGVINVDLDSSRAAVECRNLKVPIVAISVSQCDLLTSDGTETKEDDIRLFEHRLSWVISCFLHDILFKRVPPWLDDVMMRELQKTWYKLRIAE